MSIITNKDSGIYHPGVFFLVLLMFSASCERPAGPGGNSGIKGQVIEKTYDPQFRILQSELPAADEDVYIIYGSGQSVSDDRKTSPEGIFEFRYLSKGDYTIYVYSADSSRNSESGFLTVDRKVNLSSNKQTVDLGKVYIYNSMQIDEGNSTLKGKVMQVNYARDFAYIKDTTAAQDLDVFILYEDDKHYLDRIRTLYDGSFAFSNLIKGTYTVFVYADDITGGSEKIPVIKNLNIDALQGVFDTGIIYRPVED